MQKTVVACSDLHGIASLNRILKVDARKAEADVVVIAGDVQTAIYGLDPRTCFESDVIEPVEEAQDDGIDVVLVPGNHDFYLRDCIAKVSKFPDNLHVLCDSGIELHGMKFYGTPWVPTINGLWCYERDDPDLYDVFSRIPKGLDFLVSHTPPLGLNPDLYDVVHPGMERHLGSTALLYEVDKKKPKCVICGHIHSGDHTPTMVGDTFVVNVSLLDESYSQAYPPTVIKFDGKAIFKKGQKKWKSRNTTSRKSES